jgi:two-component system KDP operon response regulator KdpE
VSAVPPLTGAVLPGSAPSQPLLLVGPEGSTELRVLRPALAAAGWPWLEATDPQRARWLASVRAVSMCVLAGEGNPPWAAVAALRPTTRAPLVVLGGVPSDAVVSLIARGVDAVIEDHGDTGEVMARLAAILRRGDPTFAPGVRFLEAEDLRIDLWSKQCWRGDAAVHLSPTEYAVLVLLMSHSDRVLPISAIVREVWGWSPTDGRNALRIVVNRLRRKLDDDPRLPRYVASVRGVGYRFVGQVAQFGGTDRVRSPDPAVLLAWVEDLARALVGCTGEDAACDCLLDALVATGIADAAAVFRVDGDRMRLTGARNMSAAWRAAVADGVPLDPSFASARSVLTGHPVGFGDLRAVRGNFRSTADQLLREGVRAGHFLPIDDGRGIWGSLGLARWSEEPFDEVALAFCRTMVSVLGLVVAGGIAARTSGVWTGREETGGRDLLA